MTRKAEKRTDEVPGAGTKRHLGEWMSFAVRQESLRNKLVWLQAHVNMLDTDRHRTSGGHNYIRCKYSEDIKREVFVRATATPSHSYGAQ